MESVKITVQTRITAPLALCWSCWTKPRHITQWNFASSDWHCPRATNDLRVGGKYSARMEAWDGSVGFEFEATYDDVAHHERIRYTMADGREADTRFAEENGTTQITTIFDAESVHFAEQQREGWQAILNNFKSYVETQHAQ